MLNDLRRHSAATWWGVLLTSACCLLLSQPAAAQGRKLIISAPSSREPTAEERAAQAAAAARRAAVTAEVERRVAAAKQAAEAQAAAQQQARRDQLASEVLRLQAAQARGEAISRESDERRAKDHALHAAEIRELAEARARIPDCPASNPMQRHCGYLARSAATDVIRKKYQDLRCPNCAGRPAQGSRQ